jgi:plastocyanin
MKKLAGLAAVVLASFALTSCGGSSSSAYVVTETTDWTTESRLPPGAEKIHFEADPGGELAYTENEITAHPGEVIIEFTNPQSTPHIVKIDAESGETVAETGLISHERIEQSAELEPGTYVFYCPQPGHRAAGMEGTLTIK